MINAHNPLNNEAFDVVYTWVNHADPNWQKLHAKATKDRLTPKNEHISANDKARFQNRDELYWSIRSVRKYAPWVRNIYVLTNCSMPEWIKDFTDIHWVMHEEIFPNHHHLPTFSSHSIETVLHKIPNLSERFLYFNDDFFLCNPVKLEQFFWGQQGIYYTLSPHDIPYTRSADKLKPVDTGAINAAAFLERDYQYKPQKKLQHTPYALSRTMLYELEEKYKNSIEYTRNQKFRQPTDVAMATTLHAYYAHCTGRGRPSNIKARYIDIGDWRFLGLVHPLAPLWRNKYDSLCLNEVETMRYGAKLRDALVAKLMQKLFQ